MNDPIMEWYKKREEERKQAWLHWKEALDNEEPERVVEALWNRYVDLGYVGD